MPLIGALIMSDATGTRSLLWGFGKRLERTIQSPGFFFNIPEIRVWRHFRWSVFVAIPCTLSERLDKISPRIQALFPFMCTICVAQNSVNYCYCFRPPDYWSHFISKPFVIVPYRKPGLHRGDSSPVEYFPVYRVMQPGNDSILVANDSQICSKLSRVQTTMHMLWFA